jgi:hypothetical protein
MTHQLDGQVQNRQAEYDSNLLRVYAASLDDRMCEQCAALAGVEFQTADSNAPSLPNPACTSAHGCRCAWITIASDPIAGSHSLTAESQ